MIFLTGIFPTVFRIILNFLKHLVIGKLKLKLQIQCKIERGNNKKKMKANLQFQERTVFGNFSLWVLDEHKVVEIDDNKIKILPWTWGLC